MNPRWSDALRRADPRLRLVATCALGLEEILDAEIAALDIADRAKERGAVAFRGTWADVWRANWRLRTANRVLVELGRWAADDGPSIATGARALAAGKLAPSPGIEVAPLLHPDRSFAIHAAVSLSTVRDARWAALTAKDGLVDGQRDRFGRRADVDRREPDLALRLRLHRGEATLWLDTSVEPLDHRGYREVTTAAPVRENLAAAMVLASGWDGTGAVFDPMCGSATLLIEAADWALGRAPGERRERWNFERLPTFDAREFTRVTSEPLPVFDPELRLYGNDRSREAVAAARTNLSRAALVDRAVLTVGDAYEVVAPPSKPGLVVVNPPHGNRLDQTDQEWKRLGDLLKRQFRGWRAAVLAGEDRGKAIGLRPKQRIPIWNGPTEGRILIFELY